MARFIRPDSDVSAGSWTTTPLWSKVDEAIADDADFISGPDNANNATLELGLSNPTGVPGAGTCTVRYRHRKRDDVVGIAANIRVRLMEGATQIASWTDTCTTSWADAVHALTTPERDAIGDWNNLRLEARQELGAPPVEDATRVDISFMEMEAPETTLYLETVQAKLGGKSQQTDLQESSGPFEYVETVLAKLAGKAQLFPLSPAIPFIESMQAKMGGKAQILAAADVISYAHTVQAKMGGKAQQSEIYTIAGIPQFYEETVTAKLAGRSNLSSVVYAAVNTVSARAGGVAGLTSVFDGVGASMGRVGARAGLTDLVNAVEAPVPAKMAGRAAMTGALVGVGTVQARAAGRAAESDEHQVLDSPVARMAGRGLIAASLGSFPMVESPIARMGARAAALNPVDAAETIQAKLAGRSTVISGFGGRDTVQGKLAGRSLASELREYIEIVQSKGGLRAGIIDLQAYVHTVQARMAGSADLVDVWGDPRLIPNIRKVVERELTELTWVPESLPPATMLGDMVAPYLVINANQPSSVDSFAVTDEAVWTVIDLIYVDSDTSVDNAEKIRKRLEKVTRALLIDYKQTGGEFLPPQETAVSTEWISTPMERSQQYQEYFSEQNQPVSVMVSSIRCLTIENFSGV